MTWFRFVDPNGVNTLFEDTQIEYIVINANDVANATAAMWQVYLPSHNQALLMTLAQVEKIVGTPLPTPL